MERTVLITGASSGFGKAATLLFQSKGWNVVATMRTPEKEQELNAMDNILLTRLDVLDRESIHTAIAAGIEAFGSIDAVVNNAGYGLMGVFESATAEQIQHQFEVNVFGMMRVVQEILPHFRERGKGTIVNVSSFGGIVGLPFGSLYNSSKFAVEGFSEALSHELLPFNIGVKIIEPGGVHTNFRNGLEIITNPVTSYDPVMASFFKRYPEPTKELTNATASDVAQTSADNRCGSGIGYAQP
ncbi:SDR family NAD(P)-dependent oxidoreductase [Flavobacterium rakeshii]|uniref:SDR family NAD(P)-dependent oxidoreductase n=1 Tax=Flavobacterium rakeshii TaxID=1038845 RepID=A0A6N8HFY7_9FLAO|nr:SDR family oxidoreductase [Flavobacterium rakeshii]MUV04639.1 SDR family NAD(P)-dependent oxidoreductase [Flavobacterium rakeshii]